MYALLAALAAEFLGCAALNGNLIHVDAGEEVSDGERALASNDTYVLQEGVPYGEDPENTVDIYWPADEGLRLPDGWAAVIMLPGKDDNKSMWQELCTDYVVPTGRVCVAVDYRKDPRADRDVFAMVEWFYESAYVYAVDPANIILGGVSKGGLTINHLIWGRRHWSKGLLGGRSPKIKAVMLLSGTRADDVEAASKAGFFPASTYICSSDTDDVIPYAWSVAMYTQLLSAGEQVKFVNIPRAGHTIWYSKKKYKWYDELMIFVNETVPAYRAMPRGLSGLPGDGLPGDKR